MRGSSLVFILAAIVATAAGCGTDWSQTVTDDDSADAADVADVAADTDACVSGTQDCDGDVVLMCVGGAWVHVATACEHGCAVGHCSTCRPTALSCDGSDLVACTADGKGFERLKACPSGCDPAIPACQ